jgi:hypothetical protein
MSEEPLPLGIAMPRIGDPAIYYVLGVAALAGGFLISIAGPGMATFASGFAALGTITLVAGFCVGLFRRIEERLIDLELAILSFRDPPPPA